MIERAIESWLTKTNERNYQLPFCQVLLSKRYRVVYVSRHRSLEQGKDIVAIDESGQALAYQLKTGNIDIGTWREIRGEIVDLISLPIDHPSVPKPNEPATAAGAWSLNAVGRRLLRYLSGGRRGKTTKVHRAFLVTNGELTDEVRTMIGDMNEDNRKRRTGWSYLDVIEKNDLLRMFLEAQGTFVPRELTDFSQFLRFFTADGREFLDKERFATFLGEFVFQSKQSKANERNVLIGSTILVSELLRTYQLAENHYAQFEAWIILSAQIVQFAQSRGMKARDWEDSLQLAVDEAKSRLLDLQDEALAREDFFEGSRMGDGGEVYRARTTLVLGAIATLQCMRLDDKSRDREPVRLKLDALLRANRNRLWYWGESAFPVFYWIIRYSELRTKETAGIGVLLQAIVENSSFEGAGVPSPYYSVRDVLENMFGVEQHFQATQFAGRSWSMRPLAEMAARRGMRDEVARFWNPISRIACREFVVEEDTEFFRWLCETGTNYSMLMPETQSWKALVEESSGLVFPDIWTRHGELVRLMFLVFPHRISPRLVRFLDSLAAA